MASSQKSGNFQFAIDRGGTFTDVWARCPDGKTKVLKLLSEDPANYQDAPREGIRRILQEVQSRTEVKSPEQAWCVIKPFDRGAHQECTGHKYMYACSSVNVIFVVGTICQPAQI